MVHLTSPARCPLPSIIIRTAIVGTTTARDVRADDDRLCITTVLIVALVLIVAPPATVMFAAPTW
jgi:hypothetical protein